MRWISMLWVLLMGCGDPDGVCVLQAMDDRPWSCTDRWSQQGCEAQGSVGYDVEFINSEVGLASVICPQRGFTDVCELPNLAPEASVWVRPEDACPIE